MTEEALNEFRELWVKDHPNQNIDEKWLRDMARRVLCAIELIYKAMPKEKNNKNNEILQNEKRG